MRPRRRARSSYRVKVSYLPGFGFERFHRTKLPFEATINGRRAIVSRNVRGIQIDYLNDQV